MSAKMSWFRLHNKVINDRVVQSLSGDDFKAYINLMCIASMEGKGGYIGTIEDVSFALRETKEALHCRFIALQEVGLIVSNETQGVTDDETLHETFRIDKWSKHQYESDSSTSRVKKHRANVKRSKGVTSAVTVTPPETDTDTDTDTDKIKDLSPSALVDNAYLESHFNIFYSAGMVKKSKKSALASFKKLAPKNGGSLIFANMLAEDIRKRLDSNQLGFTELHPSSYLNGERWTDDIAAFVSTPVNQGPGLLNFEQPPQAPDNFINHAPQGLIENDTK